MFDYTVLGMMHQERIVEDNSAAMVNQKISQIDLPPL
jgi:hypothetical protein